MRGSSWRPSWRWLPRAPLRGAWATRGALLSSAWYGNHTCTLDEIAGYVD